MKMQNNNSLYTSSITITDNNSVKNGIESLLTSNIMGEENLMQQEKAVVSNDGENTTTSIIGKALNKNNFSSFTKTCKFIEKYNVKDIRKLLKLNDKLIETFWEQDAVDNCGNKWDLNIYSKSLKKHITENIVPLISKNVNAEYVEWTATYTEKPKGRMYSSKGTFSQQDLQSNIRKYLTGRYTIDLDMVKCHWYILLNTGKLLKKDTFMLERFLKDPNDFMNKTKVKKVDLLTMLYKDVYNPANGYLQVLHVEKQEIFNAIIQTDDFKKYDFKPSKDSIKKGNEISGVVAQYFQTLEHQILKKVIIAHPDAISVPMFDGANFHKQYVDDYGGVDVLINDIEQLTGFKWVQKENTFLIDIEDDGMDYFDRREEFEKDVFAINTPKRMYTVNYDECQYLLSSHELMDRYPEDLDFVKTWLADPDKRVYDRFEYLPYNAMSDNPLPANIYNTWKPYDRKVLDLNISEDEISWFNDLIKLSLVNYKNLDQPDDDCERAANWIKNWIARFIQYPAENQGVYPIFYGSQGGGKDTLFAIIAKLIGKFRVLQTTNIQDIIGEGFNSLLINKQVILLNESSKIDVIKLDGHIKGHVTAEELVIREKYQPNKTIKNTTHLAQATNDIPVIVPGCRRSIGFQTRNWRGMDKSKSPDFFAKIYACMEDENKLNILWTYLNQREVSNWKARNNLYNTHLSKNIKFNNTADWVNFCWYLVDFKSKFANEGSYAVWYGVKTFKECYKSWKYEEKGTRLFDYNVTKKQLMTTGAWITKRVTKGMKITIDLGLLEIYLCNNHPRE